MTRPVALSASSVTGNPVVNRQGLSLGKIEDVMLDTDDNRIAYAVLSFGGFLGMGEKLFAIPWSQLELDAGEHRFVLDVPRDKLEKAPGFDKNEWPSTADRSFSQEVYDYYDTPQYWD